MGEVKTPYRVLTGEAERERQFGRLERPIKFCFLEAKAAGT
jgi:hypothetical protein